MLYTAAKEMVSALGLVWTKTRHLCVITRSDSGIGLMSLLARGCGNSEWRWSFCSLMAVCHPKQSRLPLVDDLFDKVGPDAAVR